MKKFTLIELLVVMAILGILFSLLLPSLRSARQSTILAVSSSNLAQIYKASMSYTADNNYRLIRAQTPDEFYINGTSAHVQYSWDDHLMEGYIGEIPYSDRLGRYPTYNRVFEVFKCPADDIASVYPEQAPSSASNIRYRRTYSLNATTEGGAPRMFGLGETIASDEYSKSMFMAQIENANETIYATEQADYKNQVGTHYRVAVTRVNRLTDVSVYDQEIDGDTYKWGVNKNHHNNNFRYPFLFSDGSLKVIGALRTLDNNKYFWMSQK